MVQRAVVTVFGLLLSLAGGQSRAAAQSTCPTEAPRTRIKVERFLTGTAWAADRQQFGITGTAPVLLTDATDSAVCQRLRSIIGNPVNARFPLAFSYYKVAGFYVVATTAVVPEGEVWTGSSPLLVLRSDFTYVNTFAM